MVGGSAVQTGSLAVAAKRAQSVESVLERIPQVRIYSLKTIEIGVYTYREHVQTSRPMHARNNDPVWILHQLTKLNAHAPIRKPQTTIVRTVYKHESLLFGNFLVLFLLCLHAC